MNHPLRVPFHVSGRAKPHSFMYFRMCSRALVRYRTLASELSKLEMLNLRHDSAFDEVEEAAVEPVIFAGMCLEAALYDLSACLLGEEFAEKIDKLDPIGKYFVIAQHVDRETPSKSSITVQSLQALVTARNMLVHHKSQSAFDKDFSTVVNQAKKEHAQHVKGISASFKALVLLSLHFDGNIFEELRILPSFKKPEYWHGVVPSELHEDVMWCIQASKKESQRVKSKRPAP